MYLKIYTFLLIFLGLFINDIQAEYQISGQVTDEVLGESMVGVTIRVSDGQGKTTDFDGRYNFTVSGTVTLTFTYIGYKSVTKEIFVRQNDTILDIKMEETTSILDAVTVSTSRYEKNILKEAVSIDVIDIKFLENNQVTQLDQIISKVPGVQIIDEQASIRGSGFSFGAGSRVSIIVDGLPLLAPEGATIPWNYIPIENIAQIEVLKGAASVLYGTSAMNGLINVQTAYATSKPETTIQTYYSVYDNPKKEYQVWWNDGAQPNIKGLYFSHRAKVTEKFDLVIGGNAHNELSFLQGANEERYRFNINTRYRVTDRLSFGINANTMQVSKGFWGFWGNSDSLALVPNAEISPDAFASINFDPYITYFDSYNNQHSLKTRFYSITFLRTGDDIDTKASTNHIEYQFNRQLKNGLNITAGASTQILSVASPIFSYDSVAMAPGRFTGLISGIYAQGERSLLDDRLTVAFGSRWETYTFDTETQVGFPVFRVASTFAVTPKDILRTNFGQGYRLPSLAEQFIDFNNGFQNFPNPELRPEVGATYEIGYKRAFDGTKARGYLDAAVFFMDYTDLVEPVFGFYAEDSSIASILEPTNYGFKYQNISDAKILGFELGGTLNGELGVIGYRLWTGYTYTFPANLITDTTNLNNGGFLVKSAFNSIFSLDSSLHEGILPYRNLHNYRLDIELYYKKLTVGFAANYQSRMINIDDILIGEGYWGTGLQAINGGEDVFPGIKEYRTEHQQGDWVFDFRLNYELTDNLRLNFVVNNLFNYEYALRISKINPPRMFTLKLQMSI